MINNQRIRIILILFLAIFSSRFFIDNVFLGYTPKIRKNLPQYWSMKIMTQYYQLLSRLDGSYYKKKKEEEKIFSELKKSLRPIAKGVYAASKGNYGYFKINRDEVEWDYVIITLKDGRKIGVRYPKGTTPPLPETFHDLVE